MQAQATREPPQPSTEAQLQAVRERLDYEAMMQERHTFREQVSTVLSTELRAKTESQIFALASCVAEGKRGAQGKGSHIRSRCMCSPTRIVGPRTDGGCLMRSQIQSGTGTIAPCALQRAGTQSVVRELIQDFLDILLIKSRCRSPPLGLFLRECRKSSI